jgi:hypothetical protein
MLVIGTACAIVAGEVVTHVMNKKALRTEKKKD